MPSVVIAAHNEASVIGSCLESLVERQGGEPLEIVVSANGCTDRTVAVARQWGARVIDRPEPGKAEALNAADRVATSFPRIYLDADIVVPGEGVPTLLSRFAQDPAPLAVVPRRRIDLVGRPWPVRCYFAINERLPAFADGLFGRGMIALSEHGRGRFGSFPAIVADDLFLDSCFSPQEKLQDDDVEVVVAAPLRTADLIRRLIRVRRGNRELRSAAGVEGTQSVVRPSARWSWLRDVVLPHPRLAFCAIPYVVITLVASVGARRRVRGPASWGRDDSTREGSAT